MLTKLYKVLNEAIDMAAPKVPMKTRAVGFKWYTAEHKALSRKVNRAYVKYIKRKSEVNYRKYRELHVRYKKNAAMTGAKIGKNSPISWKMRKM